MLLWIVATCDRYHFCSPAISHILVPYCNSRDVQEYFCDALWEECLLILSCTILPVTLQWQSNMTQPPISPTTDSTWCTFLWRILVALLAKLATESPHFSFWLMATLM